MLELRNVTKTFQGPEGEVRAIDHASLSVRSGEIVAVQGPSGSGKTTLLLVAGALLSPTEGGVSIGGQAPYSMPPKRRARLRARTIGFVFQQFHLIPYLSVRDNILAPSGAYYEPDAERRADDLIHHLGLGNRAKHLPSQLSTGERQRTALGRALLNRPGLILADEPTGNLDSENTETVLRYLQEFRKQNGAVLLVTHDPRAAVHADRILHMEFGRIVGDTTSGRTEATPSPEQGEHACRIGASARNSAY